MGLKQTKYLADVSIIKARSLAVYKNSDAVVKLIRRSPAHNVAEINYLRAVKEEAESLGRM